jgi:hypothetical protein
MKMLRVSVIYESPFAERRLFSSPECLLTTGPLLSHRQLSDIDQRNGNGK